MQQQSKHAIQVGLDSSEDGPRTPLPRRHDRKDLGITVHLQHEQETVHGRTENLSPGGLRMASETPLLAGTPISRAARLAGTAKANSRISARR